MDAIYDSGDDLNRKSHFARPCDAADGETSHCVNNLATCGDNDPATPCVTPNVRRVSFCKALKDVDLNSPIVTCDQWDTTLPALGLELSSYLTIATSPLSSEPPGRLYQDLDWSPWLVPQPGDGGCNNCALVLGEIDTAVLQFDRPESRVEMALREPTLTVWYGDGTEINLTIGMSTAELDGAGDFTHPFKVELPARPDPDDRPIGAAVTFKVIDPSTPNDAATWRSSLSGLLLAQ
jgi:hypothetical protein